MIRGWANDYSWLDSGEAARFIDRKVGSSFWRSSAQMRETERQALLRLNFWSLVQVG